MKRSSEFLVAFAAALITFGTLTFALGPRHFEWRGHYHHGHGAYHSPNSCVGEDGEHRDNKNEQEPEDS